MSARPLSSATISFGLVSVPVQLFSASETKSGINFNWVNKRTGARCKQQYVDEKTREKVEDEDRVRGFRDPESGKWVLFTKEEYKDLEETKTERVDVVEFVPLDRVDRIFFDKGYFLGPGKGGERSYRLLAEAMKKTKLAAIGQYAARGKQYLVMLRPFDNGLVLETLHYADEVRSIADVPIPDVDVKPAELALALQIIDQLKADSFRPEQYKDNKRIRMLEQIEKKITTGQDIVAEPQEEPEAQIIDLMEALKASLAKGGAREEGDRSEMKAVRGKESTPKTTKIKRKAASG